jgi:hypothetical protein
MDQGIITRLMAELGSGRDTTAGGVAAVRGTPAFMAPDAARGDAKGMAADAKLIYCDGFDELS